MLAKRRRLPVEYPTSDGKPMAETDRHRDQMVALIDTLRHHFRNRPDVYVSGNLLMFPEEGNPRRHRAPDVLVAFGVANHRRDHYLVWEEGKAPDVVFEITSKSTRTEDLRTKKALYLQLGVKEYYLFDPLGEYLSPQLVAFHAQGDAYVPVLGTPIVSPLLGMSFRIVDGWLRLVDLTTARLLPTPQERAAAEQARADAEKGRADAEKGRADAEKARADAEKARADTEKARAEAEKARADLAERRLRELEERLKHDT